MIAGDNELPSKWQKFLLWPIVPVRARNVLLVVSISYAKHRGILSRSVFDALKLNEKAAQIFSRFGALTLHLHSETDARDNAIQFCRKVVGCSLRARDTRASSKERVQPSPSDSHALLLLRSLVSSRIPSWQDGESELSEYLELRSTIAF